MPKDYAVVELTDGTITSITLDKYLASRMRIIEECDLKHLEEKIQYWDRICHYTGPDPDEKNRLQYHFYNKQHNLHLWSNSPDKESFRGIRHWKGFEAVD